MSKIPDPKKMKKISGPYITDEQLKNVKIRITAGLNDKDEEKKTKEKLAKLRNEH